MLHATTSMKGRAMSISSVIPVPTVRAAASVVSSQPIETPVPQPIRLEPAVRVDIRAGDQAQAGAEEGTRAEPDPDSSSTRAAEQERRITIDEATKTIVYQVVDTSSGDVVVQLPDAIVLKARAYAETAAIRAGNAQRPLDRTA